MTVFQADGKAPPPTRQTLEYLSEVIGETCEEIEEPQAKYVVT